MINKKRRLKKREINGIIQLIIGIILLTSSITGIVISNNQIQKIKDETTSYYEGYIDSIIDSETDFNEMQIDILSERFTFENEIKWAETLNYNLWLFFILTIIISILFITQGAVNLTNDK